MPSSQKIIKLFFVEDFAERNVFFTQKKNECGKKKMFSWLKKKKASVLFVSLLLWRRTWWTLTSLFALRHFRAESHISILILVKSGKIILAIMIWKSSKASCVEADEIRLTLKKHNTRRRDESTTLLESRNDTRSSKVVFSTLEISYIDSMQLLFRHLHPPPRLPPQCVYL